MLDYGVVEQRDDHVRVRLAGELIGEEWTNRLRSYLKEQYVDDGIRRIILDLSDLDHIDEDGLAALTHLRSEAHRQDKRLFVEGAVGQVRSKLRVAGLLEKFAQGA